MPLLMLPPGFSHAGTKKSIQTQTGNAAGGAFFCAFPLSFRDKRAQYPVIMMKRALILSGLAFSLAVARADLVLQQNIESPMINGTVTTQIKGDKIRVDMPSSPQGAMSTIMDLNSGDSTTLMHQQKIAMKVPGAEVKQMAGPGLREICETVGIPPVLHSGSCVDNSRILIACSEMVREGGLGADLSDLPVAGCAPEWMSEKAVAIGQYFVASGALVVFGVGMPIEGSREVRDYLTGGIAKELGGRWAVEPDPKRMAQAIREHIESKRDALGINEKKERKLFDMADRRELKV